MGTVHDHRLSAASEHGMDKGQNQIDRVTEIIASAFVTVPISLAIIDSVNRKNQNPDCPLDSNRLFEHFAPRIRELNESDTSVFYTGDWSVVSIWTLPNHCPKDSEPSTALDQEFIKKCERAKQRHLKDPNGKPGVIRPFYHLEFLARNYNQPSRPGAVSAAIRPFLDRARRDNCPVWLEAGTEYAVQIYEHYGFRLVEDMKMGVGQYDATGQPKEGGGGFSVFAMMIDAPDDQDIQHSSVH